MRIVLSLIFLIAGHYACSGQTVKDFFKPNAKVNWLGVDFSHAKIIGEFSQFMGAGKKGTSEIQSVYIPAWNKLFINEMEKYDLRQFLWKNAVYIDIDTILVKNQNTPTVAFEGYNAPNYSKDSIAKFIKETNFPVRNELGVVLLADYLNKGLEESGFHFVLINMATREVLLTEFIIGKPHGFGIRNYWAGAIYDVLETVQKKRYKKWYKLYG